MQKRIKNKHVSSSIIAILLICNALPLLAASVIIPEVSLKPTKSVSNKLIPSLQLTAFSKEEIEKSPERQLTDFLKQEQSALRLNNNSGDNSETAISLRGFGDNAAANALLIVDGFPILSPSLLAPNLNAIPLADIERIDILQGSFGTLLGDQAVGGVMKIITKEPKRAHPFTYAGVSAGNENAHALDVLRAHRFDNGFFVKAYGGLSETDQYRDHNQQRDSNVLLKAGMDDARGKTWVNLQLYHHTIALPGGLSEAQYHDDPRQATNQNNRSDDTTQSVQVLNKHAFNETWLLETRFMHLDTTSDAFVFAWIDRYNAMNRISPMLIGQVADAHVQLGYDGQVGRYSLLRNSTFSNADIAQHNLYARTIIPFNTFFDVTLGGRGALQSNDVNAINGLSNQSVNKVLLTEQGITWHPSDTFSLFLRRDGNVSFPKANEQTLLSINGGALLAQTGTSYETGATWKTALHLAQLNLYQLSLQNEIAFDPTETPSQPFGAYTNLDRTRRYGVTVTDRYQLTSALALNGQLNYVNARFVSGNNAGNTIPAVPSWTANAGIHYAFLDHWQANYALLYTGNRFASRDVENSGKTLPGYWLHDASIQYVFQSGIISLEVNNVFDQVYPSYAYYDAHKQANQYYPGSGRLYTLNCKINLD